MTDLYTGCTHCNTAVFVRMSVHAGMCVTDHLVCKCWHKHSGLQIYK